MKLTITNKSAVPVPVMSNDGGGWVETAAPGVALVIDRADSQVIIIGDKPSVTEQIQQGLQILAKTAKALLDAWRNNQQERTATAAIEIEIDIKNDGPQAVRAILADGVTDAQILPGTLYHAEAAGYVELRELGNVAVDPNQHEAA